MKRILTTALSALLAISVYAADTNSAPVIEVTGTATINIVPDRITIEIGLEEYFRPSAADSVRVPLATIEKSVREVLGNAGVAESDITVSDFGNYRDRNVSSGFLMAERLSAILTDFSQLDKIGASLPDRGITSMQIVRLDNRDMESFNRQGLKAGLDAARAKAEFIADNENVRIMQLWEVVENGPAYYETPSFSNVAFDGGAGMDNMRRITRRYSVRARYLFSLDNNK